MLRYAITDRARVTVEEPAQEDALLRQAASLAETGVDFVQLREKDLEPGALVSLARKLLAVLRSRPRAPKLLINSRADVAIAVGADGVHLTSATGSLTPADIRQLYASAGLPEPIVSVSCHTLAEVAAASGPDRDSIANLILFGPVFEKVVGVSGVENSNETLIAEGIGLNLLHLACSAAAPTPVLALGGITPENTAAALAAGAAGIAAIRQFLS
ncbi:MAG TPA: thiamine phosphate synthase [Acidobacteriaceae bacterium]|jgi:thiamine-phosphate pyrophosphorylase